MMEIRYVMIVAALVAGGFGAAVCGPAPDAPPAGELRIYLPREAVVEGDQIDLGALAILRGDDVVVRRASAVAVCRFSMAGQHIVIDRATILARLASEGIDTAKTAISGAESVTLRRNEDVIAPERFVAVAEAFVKERLKDKTVSIVAVSRPKPWIGQKTAGDVRLVAREHPYSIPSRPRVWVDVVVDGRVQTGCEIAFSIRYRHQQFTATADIAKGDIISRENVSVENVETSCAPGAQTPAYGMVARCPIRKNTIIRDGMVGPETPPTVIKRRQAVVVKLETPLLLVSSVGEALDEGASGDVIRVRVNSGRDARIILTRIGDDGTVSPVI